MNLDELEIFLGTNQEGIVRSSAKEGFKSSLEHSAHTVKLVPRPVDPEPMPASDIAPAPTLQERLAEIEVAQRLGYLLCKCTWPPQIMVLTGADHVYRCRRCSRVREM